MNASAALRWIAILIACGAAWDPAVPRTGVVRPPVEVIGTDPYRRDVEARLRAEGFDVGAATAPAALVLTADRPPVRVPRVPMWALDLASSEVANVRVTGVASSSTRFPGQSARVVARIRATAMQGQSTDVALEQDGITVAAAQHRWTGTAEEWTATFDYAPPDPGPVTLRVVARSNRVETQDDNRGDVRVPGVRGPLRVFAFDAGVSWPAAFVRRSLEGEPSFAMVAKQRVSTGIVARAGAPPDALSQASLAPYEAVVVGSPGDLSNHDLDVLRWFVEVRGGVVTFVADRRPSGAYAQLLGVTAVEERLLRDPAPLEGPQSIPLRAAEMLVARGLPTGSRVLARHGSDPVVVSSPRGRGRVIFFGAVDAWRYRGGDGEGFARFWRHMLLAESESVPPRLTVDVEPALACPGERVRITARLRGTEWPASAQAIAVPAATAHVAGRHPGQNEMLRLWPTAEPGVLEGEWTATGRGDRDVTVTMGAVTADAIVTVADDVQRATEPDREGLALAARGSGGDVRPVGEVRALVSALAARLPPQPARLSTHPMRSPWWLLPFVAALSVEWTWRRKRGGR